MSAKRYFWLKLKEDFFEDGGAVEWLEEQPNGKEYALFYLKLCLKSLKSDGILMRQVGSIMVPYDAKKLAEITRTKEDTVMVALELLKNIGLVEIMDTGAIFMTQLAAMVGSETEKAEYMRRLRAKKALEKASGNNTVTLLPQASNSEASNVALEIEYRDRDIDIDLEKEIYKEKDGDQAAPVPVPPTPPPKKRKKKADSEKPPKQEYGEFKHVLLTEEEHRKLEEKHGPEKTAELVKLLDEYIEEKPSYKSASHYLAIGRWVVDALNEKESRGGQRRPAGRKEIVPQWCKNDDMKNYVAALQKERRTTENDPSLAERAEALRRSFAGGNGGADGQQADQ